MFDLTDHQRNANQKHTEIPSHTGQNGNYDTQSTTTQTGGEMSKEMQVHCWGKCKLVQIPWGAVWTFLKEPKRELPPNTATPLLRIYKKENPSIYNSHALLCSWQYYSQW